MPYGMPSRSKAAVNEKMLPAPYLIIPIMLLESRGKINNQEGPKILVPDYCFLLL